MSFIDGLRHRLRVWTRRAEYDRALEDEMRFHLELDSTQQSRAGRPTHTPRRDDDLATRRTCARKLVRPRDLGESTHSEATRGICFARFAVHQDSRSLRSSRSRWELAPRPPS